MDVPACSHTKAIICQAGHNRLEGKRVMRGSEGSRATAVLCLPSE